MTDNTIFSDMRTAIVAVITAEATKVKKVYRTDRSKFDGYPAVIVTPSENASDYGDSSMRQLDITFTVRAHQLIIKNGEDKADIVLDEVVDQLISIFNDKAVLTPTAEWVFPAGGVWGYQERPDGQVRTAEIKLKCRKYINNQ
jgi:hypothetical protein